MPEDILDCSSGYPWSSQEVPKELTVLYPNAWDHVCSLCFGFVLKFGVFVYVWHFLDIELESRYEIRFAFTVFLEVIPYIH